MNLEILVEEPSMAAALEQLVPRITGPGVRHRSIVHEGKPDLLNRLPGRLRGYRRWLPPDWRIVVLVDEDRQDCHQLKQQLDQASLDAGFVTRHLGVLNRVAVEELEAWFFGDIAALHAAYPRVSPTLCSQAGYRDSDAIEGGTWEALERVLQRAGYYSAGLPKIECASRIARHMDPDRNRSKSFKAFRDGLREITR